MPLRAALLLTALLALSQMNLMCPPPPPDPGPAQRPAVTDCGSVAVACFDELPRQPGQITVFRPTTRWNRSDLTWSVTLNPNLNSAAQETVFNAIFAAWGEVTPINFTRVASNGDIRISFERGEHGDDFPFDGMGRRLGHAWFPSSSRGGTVHLCADEDWAVPGKTGQFDLFTVALHEVGHALGVEHTLAEPAVMAYSYGGGMAALSSDDIAAVRRLYGNREGTIQPLPIDLPGQFSTAVPNLVARGDPDTDLDGIPDTMEVFYFATDPFLADTDGDGVDDLTEIFINGTNPLVGGDDTDLDGLLDEDEFFFGTDPFNFDSDGDFIGDGFELFYYGTDPLNPDTDFDGVSDFDDPFPTFSQYLLIDACAAGFDFDCNFNGLLDDCDVALGISEDFNENFVPDECEGDFDQDGFLDFEDACPFDPFKADPGFCGCGFDDFDSDEDGLPDCYDGCPFDPFKYGPGYCGCGFDDTDFNFNGYPDCFE